MERQGDNPTLTPEQLEKISRLMPFLRAWRDDFLDDLPAERIELDDPNYKRYKCRMNIYGNLAQVIHLISPNFDEPLAAEAKSFVDYVMNVMDKQAMRTREDIDRANEIHKKVIEFLESEIELNQA
jgi:hypothetical protein